MELDRQIEEIRIKAKRARDEEENRKITECICSHYCLSHYPFNNLRSSMSAHEELGVLSSPKGTASGVLARSRVKKVSPFSLSSVLERIFLIILMLSVVQL